MNNEKLKGQVVLALLLLCGGGGLLFIASVRGRCLLSFRFHVAVTLNFVAPYGVEILDLASLLVLELAPVDVERHHDRVAFLEPVKPFHQLARELDARVVVKLLFAGMGVVACRVEHERALGERLARLARYRLLGRNPVDAPRDCVCHCL